MEAASKSLCALLLLSCQLAAVAAAGAAGAAGEGSVPQGWEVRFRHLGVEDGVPDKNVYDVLQDRLGFLWLATSIGLVRYDGYTFTTYKPDPDDPTSLAGRLVTDLYEDRSGTLWIATRGGLNRFDRPNESFVSYRHDADDPASLDFDSVSVVLEDRAGWLWVGTGDLEMYTSGGGLNRLDRETGTFVHYRHDADDPQSLGFGAVISLWEGRGGELWVGTSGGGLNRFDPRSGRSVRYQHDPDDDTSLSQDQVSALLEDRSDRLWVGTWAGGLNRFEPETGTFRRYRHDAGDAASLANDRVLSLYEDRGGTLWIGTRGVLERYDPATDGFVHYRHDPLDPDSLSDNVAIWGMTEDRAGTMWLTVRGAGLDRFDRYASRFFRYAHHRPGDPGSLSHSHVTAVCEDRSGNLWVGTEGAGLDRVDAASGIVTHFRPDPGRPGSLSHGYVLSLHESPSGTLWVGTLNGLDRFEPATGSFTHFTHDGDGPRSLGGERVSTIVDGTAGELWIGFLGGGGLDRFDPATGTFTHYPPREDDPGSLPNGMVVTVYLDRAGELWIGTEGAGVCRLEAATETFDCHYSRDLGLEVATALHEDAAGRFWVGTFGGGLHLLDRATGDLRRLTDRDGLPHDVVYSILEDDEGRLWLSTGKGLSVMDPDRELFRNYDHSDGIRGDLFFGGGTQGAGGRLYYGGSGGLFAFHPRDVADNPHPPQVVLTDFRIGQQAVPIGGGAALRRHISVAEEIRLRHDENVISFSFAALHYSDPAGNRYAYRLKPLEAKWSYVGSRRFASYAHLAPGTYRFEVKAASSDGIWSPEAAGVRLIIRPPWWRTWWAYVLYSAAFLAAALTLERTHRARLVRRERRDAENQRQTRELEDARRLQLSMLPKEAPRLPTLTIAAAMETATEVGGDYYDWDLAEDGTLTIAIGDATGHGFQAGTMVTAAKSLFNYLCTEGDAARILAQSTGALRRMKLRKLLMAMMIVKVRGYRLELANAGMPPLLLYRAATRRVEEVGVGGVPLGSIVDFPYRLITADLAPGDSVVLLSDGLPELLSPDGEVYGYERLEAAFGEVAERSPEEIIRHFTDLAADWAGRRPRGDDMTFVVLGVRRLNPG